MFIDREDLKSFLALLADVVERYNWLCYAYCLMPNHYHLLVETLDANLSIGIRQLNGVYTQKFNKKHARTGHVFQGRFKAILVQKESHLLELCRYVVLNPIRAQLTSHPEEWKWSSYSATIGTIEKPKFLSADWVLGQLGHNTSTARRAYRNLVTDGIKKESPWKNLKGRIFLGKEDFIRKVTGSLNGKEAIKEIPRVERLAGRPPLEEILGEMEKGRMRDEKMYIAHIRYGYSLTEIGNSLGIHYSTVSKTLKKLRSREQVNNNSLQNVHITRKSETSIQESRPDPSA